MTERPKFSWKILAMWYLTMPVILFFATWLRAPYNIFFVVIVLGTGLKYSIDQIRSQQKTIVHYRYLIITLLMSVALIILSGAGGFVWQKSDWTKHNVVLNDLIQYRWPVNYGASAFVEQTTLVYYIAYYLPAALVGKLLGWRAGELGLFAQSLVGIYIFAQLIGERIRHSSIKFLLFFLMSGADIVGLWLLGGWPPESPHLEYYALGLQYSSVMTLLMWVPQHALVGWITALLAYDDYTKGKIHLTLPWYVAITLLWSPFVSLGLLIVFVPFILFRKIREYLNAYSIGGALLFGIIFLYYQSQIHILNNKANMYLLSSEHVLHSIGTMIGFLILDVYIFAIVLILVKDKIQTIEKKLITWVFIVLLLIPQVMYGAANDFVMRASIPALTIVFVFVLRYLDDIIRKKSYVMVVALILIIFGICTPLAEVYRGFQKGDSATNEQPIYSMINAHLKYKVLHQQYMGLATKAFGRYFGNYTLIIEDEK